MKQEANTIALSKKLDRSLLALHAAQTPATLSQAAFACTNVLVGAERALVIFSPGPGLAPKLFQLGASGEASESWLHESLPQDCLIRHLFERQSAGPLHLNRVFTSTELAASRFASKWLQQPAQPYIVALSAVARESSSVLMFIFRNETAGDYGCAGLEQLDWFYSHFKIAWLRVFVREETLAIYHSLQTFLRQSPNGLTVLNWDLDVVYRNAEAAECCALWNFGPDGARKVQPSTVFRCPEAVIALCHQLKAEFQEGRATPVNEGDDAAEGAAHGAAVAGQCSAPGPDGMRALVRLVVLKSSALQKPVLQVRFSRRANPAGAVERGGRSTRPVAMPNQMSSLTLREREVVDCICRGLSNEAIAQQLSKSVPTVKNQLHSIFQKLAVPSRAALIALIQGDGNHSRPAERRV